MKTELLKAQRVFNERLKEAKRERKGLVKSFIEQMKQTNPNNNKDVLQIKEHLDYLKNNVSAYAVLDNLQRGV